MNSTIGRGVAVVFMDITRDAVDRAHIIFETWCKGDIDADAFMDALELVFNQSVHEFTVDVFCARVPIVIAEDGSASGDSFSNAAEIISAGHASQTPSMKRIERREFDLPHWALSAIFVDLASSMARLSPAKRCVAMYEKYSKLWPVRVLVKPEEKHVFDLRNNKDAARFTAVGSTGIAFASTHDPVSKAWDEYLYSDDIDDLRRFTEHAIPAYP